MYVHYFFAGIDRSLVKNKSKILLNSGRAKLLLYFLDNEIFYLFLFPNYFHELLNKKNMDYIRYTFESYDFIHFIALLILISYAYLNIYAVADTTTMNNK